MFILVASFQKETKSAITVIKKEQAVQRKLIEGLEKRIIDTVTKKINTNQNQTKDWFQSITETLQKLEKKTDSVETLDSSTPFTVPTIRRKRNRSFYSQEVDSKKVMNEHTIESTVSTLIQTAIQNKPDTGNLFLIDDFFSSVS